MLLALAWLAACGPQYLVVAPGDETTPSDTGLSPGEDPSAWDQATLVVLSPSSGDFLPWGEPAEFAAELRSADGSPLDFDAVTWTSDADESWELTGAVVTDDTLGVGTHAITASAELPNGDRLAWTVGGVLVQSIYAGTYTGTLRIDAAMQGYQVGCSGAATLVIEPYGEIGSGEASCLLSLQGYDIDLSYLLDLSNDGGRVGGQASLDIYGYTFPMDFDGELTTDGQLAGGFYDVVLNTLEVDGELTLQRISRDTGD